MSTVRHCLIGSLALTVSVVFAAAPVAAQPATPPAAQPATPPATPPAAPAPQVRPLPHLRALVQQASQRSALIQSLIADIETTDLVVYIRTAPLPSDLDGRTGLLTVHGGRRYFVIELSCRRSTLVQMATLGHELFHVVEIAHEPAIVDARTLAAFYQRIGSEAGGSIWQRTFETSNAVDAGRRARHQLQTAVRSANGT